MQLLAAYEALVTSPGQLAQCGQAQTIGELMARLKSLWGLQATSDDQMISALNACNRQVLDLDPGRLAGHWLPIGYGGATRSLSWCLPQGHPTEPFLDQYIQRCQQHLLNQFIRPRTRLPGMAAAPDETGPVAAGFIFHLSRCGSTLLSGCLAERDDTLVLSESPLLTDLLLDASLPDDEKARLLARLVQWQALPFRGRHHAIVKWNAWDLFAWPVIRSALPGVPRVRLFREPEEILASHARQAGRHMAGDPALGFLDPALDGLAVEESVLEWRIRVVKALAVAMSGLAGPGAAMTLDYRQLDSAAVAQVCRHFGLPPDAGAAARMTQRMAFHSKAPDRPYESDERQKQAWFTPGDRQRIHAALAPAMDRLRSLARP